MIISQKVLSVWWIQIIAHTAGRNVKEVLFVKSLLTRLSDCIHFLNPSFHILLTPSYILRHPLLFHHFCLISYPSFHLIHPLLLSAHPSSQIFLNNRALLLVFGLVSPSLPLCFLFLSLSPYCLPSCPHSPFALSAVNGSIMSLLSIKWWKGGVNTAA